MPLPPRIELIEVALTRPFNDRASLISNAEFRKPLHERVLEWSQARHHGYHGIAENLGKLMGSAHYPGQEISGLDDRPNYRKAFGAVAVEQLLVAVAMQREVELPNQIPNVLKSGIHALPAKRAVNVSGVPGYEDPSDTQLRRMTVMDVKIAAPVEGVRLNPGRRTLAEYFLHEG